MTQLSYNLLNISFFLHLYNTMRYDRRVQRGLKSWVYSL